jgi:ribonuclease HI
VIRSPVPSDPIPSQHIGTQSLQESITIFGDRRSEDTPQQNPPDPPHGPPNQMVTAYTDGACLENGTAHAIAGCGVWYGDSDPRNISERVPLAIQSNQTGELMAILLAVKNHDPNGSLRLISNSKYVIEGLTKHLRRWEQRGWMDVANGGTFKTIIAWIRWRRGKTYLRWTRGHNGTVGNEEADRLAGEGARRPQVTTDGDQPPAQDDTNPGATLAKMEQRDFYRILRDRRKIPRRTTADQTVENIQDALQETQNKRPTTERVWLATKHKDLTRKTRDFLWKGVQGTYKIGAYWSHIDGYQDRATCTVCNEREDLNHILLECRAGPRATAWKTANEVWKKRSQTELPTTLGDILGCGLATFETEGKQDKGKGRLYRILVSETAYLIWKLRNERTIRDENGPPQSPNEVHNKWINTMNKRLTTDRLLTNTARFQSNAVDNKLVKATWTNCLKEEENLPANWPTARGVLVGILAARPPGHAG